MLKSHVISRDSSGNFLLNHVIAAGTYSAAPTLVTDGFYIRCDAGKNYDAYEILTSMDATAGADTVVTLRPWSFVPSHDPASSGGVWTAGKLIDHITRPQDDTEYAAPARRINAVPVGATRLYVQVVSVVGTAPDNVYMTCYGIDGTTADIGEMSVDIEAGDIEIGAVEIKDHTTDDRAHVKNANVAVAIDDHVMMVQVQGPDGLPMPSGANAAGAVYVLPVGGGAAGGGDSVYTSPADFTATRNAATELLITGLPFSILAQVVSVYRVDIVTGIGYTYTTSTNTLFWNAGTGVLTVTGATFLVTDEFRVTLFGPDKAATPASNSKRVQEISPLSTQNVWENLVTNATLGAATYYYPSSSGLNVSGYRSLGAQIQMGTTAICTLEASFDTTGTDWEDVSRAAWDMKSGASGVANWAGTTAMLDLEACIAPLIRFKVVVSVQTAVQIDVRRTAI